MFERLRRFFEWLDLKWTQAPQIWAATVPDRTAAVQGARRWWKAQLFALVIGFLAVVLLLFICKAVIVWYGKHYQELTPLLTLLAGLALASVALLRHFAQTNADRQRRITESFSKAVEQLGSDKLEIRLGGIYSLERISKESDDDYWTVMENLSAFIRERSQRV